MLMKHSKTRYDSVIVEKASAKTGFIRVILRNFEKQPVSLKCPDSLLIYLAPAHPIVPIVSTHPLLVRVIGRICLCI